MGRPMRHGTLNLAHNHFHMYVPSFENAAWPCAVLADAPESATDVRCSGLPCRDAGSPTALRTLEVSMSKVLQESGTTK
jgi:hypothetical protein